jgi:hypothetical protein
MRSLFDLPGLGAVITIECFPPEERHAFRVGSHQEQTQLDKIMTDL